MRPGAAPILPPEALAGHLRLLRATRSPVVVLANGCFDLLHLGHLEYLEGAAACGDILVVGVNGDAAVRWLKGPGRPLLPAHARAALVAALAPVDYVTVFHERTAHRLITLLRPHVHCKGPDYADGVPEEAAARSVGARVEIVGGPKGHDATGLIQRIRALSR